MKKILVLIFVLFSSNVIAHMEHYNKYNKIEMDILTLSTCEKGFGSKKEIHIWISSTDYKNSNLMIY